MDVDMELDSDLMTKFSSLGTTDRDVLVGEFQKLAGNNLNPTACAFFLDMNNWNLQAAIGSYYDIENSAPQTKLPRMTLIKDVTIGEGESITPNTEFTKTWRVKNNGDEPWPPGICLRFTSGHQLGPYDHIFLEHLEPQQTLDISIRMCSPSACGLYQGQWRMCTTTGFFFGETIWVILDVRTDGMLGLTQQMSSLATDQTDPSINSTPLPFGGSPSSPGRPPDSTTTHPQLRASHFQVNHYDSSSPPQLISSPAIFSSTPHPQPHPSQQYSTEQPLSSAYQQMSLSSDSQSEESSPRQPNGLGFPGSL
ncbi:protein ILRUN-like [Patiria miniata]|uniref:Nbr1 FW domain-containing protein n=1 Tax=Patiria miniata TaxID=46514 RepID=A0A913ZJF0_PATMI|nr:protein ILRUN-like [Patiria miniata]